jgi:GTP-binding protein
MRFLRHVERTRLLVHLIDTSDSNDDDPVHSYEVISGELAAFSKTLTDKPLIVVATKLDATTDRTRLEALRDFCQREGLEFHSISAATGDGVKELVRSIADALDKIPKPAPDAADALDAADGQMADAASATAVPASVHETNAPLVSRDEKS